MRPLVLLADDAVKTPNPHLTQIIEAGFRFAVARTTLEACALAMRLVPAVLVVSMFDAEAICRWFVEHPSLSSVRRIVLVKSDYATGHQACVPCTTLYEPVQSSMLVDVLQLS